MKSLKNEIIVTSEHKDRRGKPRPRLAKTRARL